MRRWTEQEISFLKKTFEKKDVKVLATILNRTQTSIRSKAAILGLSRPKTRHMANHTYFQNWSNKMAYILGFWATDGNAFIQRTTKRISFSQKEREVLEKIRGCLQSTHTISKIKTWFKFAITSQIMFDSLCEIFDMDIRNKSLTIKFPAIPQEHIKSFLLGCVDGDGSLKFDKHKGYKDSPTICFVSGSKHFFDGFCDAVEHETGIIGRKRTTKTGLFTIRYFSIKASCLADYLYYDAELYLDRKMERAKRMMTFRPRWIYRKSLTPKMRRMFPHILNELRILG